MKRKKNIKNQFVGGVAGKMASSEKALGFTFKYRKSVINRGYLDSHWRRDHVHSQKLPKNCLSWFTATRVPAQLRSRLIDVIITKSSTTDSRKGSKGFESTVPGGGDGGDRATTTPSNVHWLWRYFKLLEEVLKKSFNHNQNNYSVSFF